MDYSQGSECREWSDHYDKVIHSISIDTLETISRMDKSDFKFSTMMLGLNPLKLLKQTFLPIGFPSSIPPDYLPYQFWNLLQDLCSYLRGILAARAVLISMGVGRSEATAYQAILQWLLRDGAGLVGGLLFTSLTSYNFGQNVKVWRLFADMINNVGITLDMLAPLLPYQACALILCIASICKSLCGVAAGATGAAINAHFGSLFNNNADIVAKNAAQHNLVTLIGLAFSVWLAKIIDEVGSFVWIIYLILTVVHIFSNYRAMRVLALRSINFPRYKMLIDRFLSSSIINTNLTNLSNISDSFFDNVQGWLNSSQSLHLFAPSSIAESEPILELVFPFRVLADNKTVVVEIFYWKSIKDIILHVGDDAEAKKIVISQLQLQCGKPYVILSIPVHKGFHIFVLFTKGCRSLDIAKGIFEAEMWRYTQNIEVIQAVVDKLFVIWWASLKMHSWITDKILLKPAVVPLFEITGTPSRKND